MTTEEQILERLDRIEAQLAPVSASAKGLNELREDLIPLSGVRLSAGRLAGADETRSAQCKAYEICPGTAGKHCRLCAHH
jgi:hypothetical protein